MTIYKSIPDESERFSNLTLVNFLMPHSVGSIQITRKNKTIPFTSKRSLNVC